MFWTVVSAILFVYFILPLIFNVLVAVGIVLATNTSPSEETSKKTLKTKPVEDKSEIRNALLIWGAIILGSFILVHSL